MTFIGVNIAIIEATSINIENFQDSKSENQDHILTLLLKIVIASPILLSIWFIMGIYFIAAAILLLISAILLAILHVIFSILRLCLIVLAFIVNTIGNLLMVFDQANYLDDSIPWFIS